MHPERVDIGRSMMKRHVVFRAGGASLFCGWMSLILTGCASSPSSGSSSGGGGTTVPAAASLSGNWQGTLTPASGTPALTAIAGVINQAGSVGDSGQFTTSVLQVAGDCFIPSPIVPLQGNNKAGAVTLDSYDVNAQQVHLVATANSDGSALQGTYSVNSGCANGANGSFTANRYAALTGTYTGTLSAGAAAGPTVSANLTQAAGGTGSGTFLMTGTITLTGAGCTGSGTAVAAEANYVQGSHLQISFPATDGGLGAATLTGTFDAGATTISNATLTVAGGGCAGYSATGTLKH